MNLPLVIKIMDLSVIIVSYNVKAYLDQCLKSVIRASKNIDVEIIVVDNFSKDDSVEHIKTNFPSVHLIQNKSNLGFGSANNIGVKEAKGDYILFLNPDTIVGEDNFELALKEFRDFPNLGSLGCRMIDGKGNFLPESKRGFPTPWVAFYRIIGLAKLFPKSKKWAGYYLGNVDESQNAQSQIHCGAWMMLSKEALNKSHGFDEAFFMYGEDIDLSYRIMELDYENRYFATSPIIHFKGESTKHSSWSYVKNFHQSMDIFFKKHLKTNARSYSFLIRLGIYSKASSEIIRRYLLTALPILLTFIIGFFLANEFISFWESNYRYPNGGHYPSIFKDRLLPVYLTLWVSSMIINGAYLNNASIIRYFTGFITSTSVILIFYSLLPSDLRFSRILILISCMIFFITFLLIKFLLNIRSSDRLPRISQNTVAHVNRDSSEPINQMINYDISIDDLLTQKDPIQFSEIHFYPEKIDLKKIIRAMIFLRKNNLKYRFKYASWTLGSDDYQSSSDLSMAALSKPEIKRTKNILNILITFIVIIGIPIFIWSRKGRFVIKSLPEIFLLKKIWVGYISKKPIGLPSLRDGVFCHSSRLTNSNLIKFADIRYAHHWRPEFDIYAFFNGPI